MSENRNDTETEYASIKDLFMPRKLMMMLEILYLSFCKFRNSF